MTRARPLVLVSTLLLVPACVDDTLDTTGGALGGEGDGDEVLVCHVPPGNHANAHTIVVGDAAVEAHLAHGDQLGACDGDGDGDGGGGGDGGCVAEAEVCDGVDNDCDGLIDTGCLGGLAWNDADQDGLQSATDAGPLAGVTFILRTSSSGAVVAVTTSDGSGFYTFSGVPAGGYVVEAWPVDTSWGFSPKDVGGDDQLDNDFDWGAGNEGVTDPFTYDGSAGYDLDCGLWSFSST